MTRTFASIGECMIELSSAGDGLYRRGFAGDTLNTAWSVRALCDPDAVTVRYVSGIGDDAVSQEMAAFIANAGIDVSGLQRVPGRTLGLYMITLDGHERSFAYWRDQSAARLLAEDGPRLEAILADADMIYLSGITLAILSPEHRARLLAILADRRGRGAAIVFDGNVRPRLWPGREAMRAGIEAGYRAATIALPTFDDEKALFADASAEDAARRLLACGVEEAVLKNGPEPCLVATRERMAVVPAVPVNKPVDTTGAGDSFNAGYLAGRLAGLSPVEAATRGHRVAAQVIQSHGALVEPTRLRAAISG